MQIAAVRRVADLLRTYLQFVSRTSTLRIGIYDHDALSFLDDPIAITDISAPFSVDPTILPFWNAHSLLIITSYLGLTEPLKRQLSSLRVAADDTSGGQITSALFGSLGLASRRISFTDQAQRFEDIKELLREKPKLAVAADSHGPYRQVSMGLARFVKSYRGVVRPISVWCNRGIPIFRQIRMLLPLPYSTLVFGIGRAIDLRASSPRVAELRELLQRSLRDLEAYALMGNRRLQAAWTRPTPSEQLNGRR